MEGAGPTRETVNREIDLTHQTLRRAAIPVNYGDVTYLTARAHGQRSPDDLRRRIDEGRPIDGWSSGQIEDMIARKFQVDRPVLRQALDTLTDSFSPGRNTVTGLRRRLVQDPALGATLLEDLTVTGRLRRKLPLLAADGITTLSIFAERAHDLPAAWVHAVLGAMHALPPHATTATPPNPET